MVDRHVLLLAEPFAELGTDEDTIEAGLEVGTEKRSSISSPIKGMRPPGFNEVWVTRGLGPMLDMIELQRDRRSMSVVFFFYLLGRATMGPVICKIGSSAPSYFIDKVCLPIRLSPP